MLWIGITGAMGSGKSTVAKVLKEKGFPVLDADGVVHDLLKAGGPLEREILSTFGQSVKAADGTLDRRALGRLVFSSPEKLQILEGILHPKVRQEVARLKGALAKTGSPVAFYDVPLLFEKKMEDQFDFILVVSAEESVRRRRIQERMKLSDADITARFNRQMNPEIKERNASAVIRNNSSMDNLVKEMDAALRKIGVALPSVRDS